MVCKDCGKKNHTAKTCLFRYENLDRVTSNEECSICLTKTNKPKCKTSCQHTFHISCLKNWLERNTTCPLCRYTICHKREQVLLILIASIEEALEEIEDIHEDYLLMNPGMIEDMVESYFQNENLI